MLLLQLREESNHAAEEDDCRLETTDAKKHIERVIKRVHGKILAVKVLDGREKAIVPLGGCKHAACSQQPCECLSFQPHGQL